MKKIKTLFKIKYLNHKWDGISEEPNENTEWVFKGQGKAYIKRDGTACMIKDGKLYKRYDNKKNKPLPQGAIPCEKEADPITKHWPHWVPVLKDDPGDKWHNLIDISGLKDGTYELVGKGVQGNIENKETQLISHTSEEIEVPRTFEGLKGYFELDIRGRTHEGIVFRNDDNEMFKIRLKDFGRKRESE